MSAKPAKRKATSPANQPIAATATAAAGAAPSVETATPSWLDSADPRKRLWGKIILVALWIYVAALWLLALDQSFRWGIFGPKIPPVP